MNYQEVVGSDTEEEILSSKKTTRKIISDDEDEFKIEESDEGEPKVGGEEKEGNDVAKRLSKMYDTEESSGQSSYEDEEEEEEEEDHDDNDNSNEEEKDEDNAVDNDDDSADNKSNKGAAKKQIATHKEPSTKVVETYPAHAESMKTENSQSAELSKEEAHHKLVSSSGGSNVPAIDTDLDKHENDSTSNSEDRKKDLLGSARFSTSTSNAVKSGLVGPPPLKIRVSKGGLASLSTGTKAESTSAPPNQSQSHILPPVVSKPSTVLAAAKPQTTATVSQDLRQKLQLALTKKIKSQISDQRDLPEDASDEEEEDSAEELSDMEHDDEVDDDDDDDVMNSGDEGNMVTPFASALHKTQNIKASQNVLLQTQIKENARATFDREDRESGLKMAPSENSQPPGIRVISPMKLLANPPMEQTRFPIATPVPNPQQLQLIQSVQTMPPIQPVINKMGIENSVSMTSELSPPKRRGRGRGKKQLALEKAAQEQIAMERIVQDQKVPQQQPLLSQQQQMAGGSVIRGMLQTGQPHGFSPAPRQPVCTPDQMPPRSETARSPQFPPMVKGRVPPFPVQRAPFPGNQPHRMIRPPQPLYHSSHRPLDPSPSGGGAISAVNVQSTSSKRDTQSPVNKNVSSPQDKNLNVTQQSPAYISPQGSAVAGMRFPVPESGTNNRHSQNTSLNYMSSSQNLPRPAGNFPPYQQPSNYYSGYPGIISEEAMSPAGYQSSQSPFMEQQQFSESNQSQTETENSKSFDDEVSGGEFGGLVSYFSSQREEDGLDT